MIWDPVPVSFGCEKTVLACSTRLRLRSGLMVIEVCDGAGNGVELAAAAAVRLFESLWEDEVRLDLKALNCLSRYDMAGRWIARRPSGLSGLPFEEDRYIE